jgi:hypothetical protein
MRVLSGISLLAVLLFVSGFFFSDHQGIFNWNRDVIPALEKKINSRAESKKLAWRIKNPSCQSKNGQEWVCDLSLVNDNLKDRVDIGFRSTINSEPFTATVRVEIPGLSLKTLKSFVLKPLSHSDGRLRQIYDQVNHAMSADLAEIRKAKSWEQTIEATRKWSKHATDVFSTIVQALPEDDFKEAAKEELFYLKNILTPLLKPTNSAHSITWHVTEPGISLMFGDIEYVSLELKPGNALISGKWTLSPELRSEISRLFPTPASDALEQLEKQVGSWLDFMHQFFNNFQASIPLE